MPRKNKSESNSLGYKLESSIGKIFWALVVVVSSAVMLIALKEIYRYLHPERNTWVFFWTDWGAAIGVFYGVILTAIVVMIPSKVEGFMTTLAERIQSPLTDFSQVMERASQLLVELDNQKGTVFKVISASPILGLEVDDATGSRWEKLLVDRILADCETDIVCLDPGTQFSTTAPLTTFCRALADYYLKDPRRWQQLLDRGREQIDRFQDQFKNRPNLTMKFGEEPGYQIIIARDRKGMTKAILFFSSSLTLARGINPSGFYTEDGHMVTVLEKLFDQELDIAKKALEDPRNLMQRKRDTHLQVLHGQNPGDREIAADEIAPGFKLIAKAEVFPPDIELAGKLFSRAIELSADLVWKNVPKEHRLGIDVGTGTGILALILAKYSPEVVATDNSDIAIANAKENFKRFTDFTDSGVEISAQRCDLLAEVERPSAKQVPLIVFNHPYYPSPANVYNIGGLKAGMALIVPFLEQARTFLNNGGGVVMAYSEVAGVENSPVDAAFELKYKPELLVEADDAEFGFQKIFLFRK